MALMAAAAAGPVEGWAGEAAELARPPGLALPLDPWLAPLEHAAGDRHSAAQAAAVASRAGRAPSQRRFLMGQILPPIG
jgi:hypothetical protein